MCVAWLRPSVLGSVFDHLHHQLIYTVLRNLNADLFTRAGAHFGGGTLITLHHGEYRWSKDVDFLCAVGPGYRLLRTELMERGTTALFKSFAGLTLPREAKADQYGIRLPLLVDGSQEVLKLEIVAESRICLESPECPAWSPVPVLSLNDRFAEKLLANADRWNDRAVEARDLIDLSVLRLYDAIPDRAIAKAEEAYPVMVPLRRAIQAFQTDPSYRRACFDGLRVHNRGHIINGLDQLAADFALPSTVRTLEEAGPEDEVLEYK